MKIKSKHLIICAITILSIVIATINIKTAYAWNDDDPDNPFDSHSIVTFGLYKSDTGQIEVSQPDYFFDHFKYGLAHGIYNYIYPIWHDNADFNFDVSILWDNLLEQLGSEFFSKLTSGFWLMNVYLENSYTTGTSYNFRICCNRAPNIQYSVDFDVRYNLNDKLTVEILPENFGASFFVFGEDTRTYYRVYSYAPYYINDNISLNSTSLNSQENSKFAYSNLTTQMEDVNLRSFWFTITVNALTGVVSTPSTVGWVKYYNSSTLRGSSDRLDFIPLPVMVDFPTYYINNYRSSTYITYETDSYYSGIKFNPSKIYEYLQNHSSLLERDYNLSPIIISRYDEIPVPTGTPTPTATPSPTPTPTSLPSITLMPSPTPSGVEPIEGISTMFTLFTRKYDINVMGVTVGIRPFFIFIGCFLVGSIITMIQGGNKS